MATILINADDFGLSQEANLGIDYCFGRGFISRASLIVNGNHCDDAVNMARMNGYENRIGLHLNLAEGKPLTEGVLSTSLCNANGEFSSEYFTNTWNRFHISMREREKISDEIEAQIEKYLKYNLPLMHLDSHQHSHVNPSILSIVLNLSDKYGFMSIRVARNIPESQISWAKKIIKSWQNYKVVQFNLKHAKQEQVANMLGSQDDIDKALGELPKDAVVEMMLHPLMKQNRLYDLYNSLDIEEWLKTNQRIRLI